MTEATFYYKSKAPELVNALGAHFDEMNEIGKKQRKFARLFGGVAMRSVVDWRLCGLSFSGCVLKDPDLWTQPDKHGLRKPKRTGGGEAGAALRKRWAANFPHDILGVNPFLVVLKEPQFLPGRRMGYTLKGGVAYLSINHPMKSKLLTEILASEYVRADKQKE